MRMNRLRLIGVLAAALITGAAVPAQAHDRPTTLAELAQQHGRYYGSATDNPELVDEPYKAILGSEFDMITPATARSGTPPSPSRVSSTSPRATRS